MAERDDRRDQRTPVQFARAILHDDLMDAGGDDIFLPVAGVLGFHLAKIFHSESRIDVDGVLDETLGDRGGDPCVGVFFDCRQRDLRSEMAVSR